MKKKQEMNKKTQNWNKKPRIRDSKKCRRKN